MRGVIATIIVVGLAVGIWLLWPDAAEDAPPVTPAMAVSGTTSSTARAKTTTTSSVPTTSTTTEALHVVETVEEAEDILRNHYFRWFEGIYRQDESMIRALVIQDSQADAAIAQFGAMEFLAEPNLDSFRLSDTEILRSDEECLAVSSTVSASFRLGSTAGVVVFRRVGSRWLMISTWRYRGDLWEEDCESVL